jgi:hypothetical protein
LLCAANTPWKSGQVHSSRRHQGGQARAIRSSGSSKLTDREVEHLLAKMEIKSFASRDDQEVESGMGAYHGEAGFVRFSHARAVFRQTWLDVAGLVD